MNAFPWRPYEFVFFVPMVIWKLFKFLISQQTRTRRIRGDGRRRKKRFLKGETETTRTMERENGVLETDGSGKLDRRKEVKKKGGDCHLTERSKKTRMEDRWLEYENRLLLFLSSGLGNWTVLQQSEVYCQMYCNTICLSIRPSVNPSFHPAVCFVSLMPSFFRPCPPNKGPRELI